MDSGTRRDMLACWVCVSFAWPCLGGPTQSYPPYLSKKIQRLVQIGIHARGWLVGDFDGVFQDALWDDVCLGCGSRLSADEHSVVLVAARTEAFHFLVQDTQPSRHQVNVLWPRSPASGLGGPHWAHLVDPNW